MVNVVKEIQARFSRHDDFFFEEEQKDKMPFYLMGFNTLIDLAKSNLYVRQVAASSSSVNELFINLSDQLDVDTEKLIKAILEGKLVIVLGNGKRNAIVDPVSRNLRRNIDKPQSESPLQGPLDAFVEDIKTNIGLIRKRLDTERLCHSSHEVGKLASRKLSMLYIKGRAPDTLIKKINKQIKQIDTDIETVDDLNKYFGQRSSIVSHVFLTELPSEVTHLLKKNRVVLLLDNYPFALVFPNLLLDMFCIASDRNYPSLLAYALRTLRVVGAVINVLLPALYVAIVSVNPEILKIDLALFVSESRRGIPFPALLETMIMVVLVDLTLEAIVRLPKSVGPTITMVGGIILGQAMVQAKLVSPLLVIVVTAIVISGSVVSGIQNSLYIRLLRYPILILASIYGVLGVFIGFLFTIVYLASLTSNGIPYTAFRIRERGTQNES
ncbi:GerA spore germination protein [Scopulibacillus darangshiensis]|uniref:GerA spore germination protein n=1 Tax=Scopulibacillus darangshiensis TaxID=442528 RepID=A0A4R2NIQ9_9BACL|nr:spore germination protein [Scopulibacillus darangshiensis]TCP21301.1 GerA spore germination protein [Scopulibacillus darangshiensis]